MTNTREQMARALMDGDSLEKLDCYYIPGDPHIWQYSEDPETTMVRCRGDELPTREYDSGYGGVDGEHTIAYSERYVYVKVTYDGAEWFSAVPRHQLVMDTDKVIPVLGGG